MRVRLASKTVGIQVGRFARPLMWLRLQTVKNTSCIGCNHNIHTRCSNEDLFFGATAIRTVTIIRATARLATNADSANVNNPVIPT